ncbi:MAG TPA: hypothetical protein VGQ19_17330 [Burkholderiales bacterium]|jgi:hypothetical protein|nr:hypothetical protein [Burkholderiales bacterium]
MITSDSLTYQEALSKAYAGIKTILQRRQLDPLRYIVDIDSGQPVFAPRNTHLLRIAYNRHEVLSTEVAIPHEWLLGQAGAGHENFLRAVDAMVLELKDKVHATGRPL